MIKRTIEISGEGIHLSVAHGSLIVKRDDETISQVPLEDLGVLVLDSPQATYTHWVLTEALSAGAVVIPCGRDHLPRGLFLPQENTLQTARLADQARASLPLRKSLWKQVVSAKVANQTGALNGAEKAVRALRALVPQIRSGDPTNVEAQAARIYWPALFEDAGFRRLPEGPPPNNFLNYGYMVLRAAVARAICAAGLHPSLGLHHHNQYNSFCLADDLLEPLRPLIDVRARDLHRRGFTEIDRNTKYELLSVLTDEIEVGGEKGPLSVALERTVASLVRCYAGQQKKLDLPKLWN